MALNTLEKDTCLIHIYTVRIRTGRQCLSAFPREHARMTYFSPLSESPVNCKQVGKFADTESANDEDSLCFSDGYKVTLIQELF